MIALIGFGIYLPIEVFMSRIAPADVAGFKDQFEVLQVELIFELLFGMMASIFVVRLTANTIDGESTRFGDVWKSAMSRYFSSVATTIASQVVFWGLFVLLVIPGLAGLVYMTFYLQVVVLRKETGFHALKQSKRIVEGRFWRVAGYALFFVVTAELLPWIDSFAPTPMLAVPIGACVSVVQLFFTI